MTWYAENLPSGVYIYERLRTDKFFLSDSNHNDEVIEDNIFLTLINKDARYIIVI